ncbi:hypothetical protein Tco_0266531 [Tanacetum coccineum]
MRRAEQLLLDVRITRAFRSLIKHPPCETVKSVVSKKTTRSIRKVSSRQDSQSQENVSPLLVLPQAIKCKLWHLKKSTIIALGTIYKTDGKQMLHNKELPKDCYKVSIDKSLVDAACIPDVGNNGFKTVKDVVGGFFAWPKNQVVLDPKATPPSTIQMIDENKTAPKLQTKRKNVYFSCDAMQKQARKKSQKAEIKAKKHKVDSMAKIEGLKSMLNPSHRRNTPHDLDASQYAGSDTRPPMLDRTDFESWQQRIRLYCLGKDNGENIMESITEGPFKMGTFIQTPAEETEGALQLGPERARVFTNLSTKEKERFTKLINDMRNIKMTMPIMQLNSKFVNNMLPEWSRFITEVKLNRGLKESNFDQLYAYLKQHEVHASENRMMMERFIQPTNDPLALVSNASVQQKPISENNARGNVVAGNAGGQNRGDNMNPGQAKPIKGDSTNLMMIWMINRELFAQQVDHILKLINMNAFELSDVARLLIYNHCSIKILETQLQEKDNAIRNLKAQVSKMNDRSCETYNAKDVTALIEQNECVRVELEKVKQHYKELYDSIKITRVHTREKTSTMLNEIESLKAQLKSKVSCVTSDSVKPKVLAPGIVNTSTEASGSKPRSNTKKNRILPAKSENKKKVEDHPRTNNSVNATPTVKIVLNKGKQIWKPKGKLSDNSLNKSKRVWKATGKLFADIGYQWRPTGKKFTLGKLNCGYQWRPTGKKFALGELCPLTKLSVKCRTGRPLVSGLRLFKTYDGESFKAQELCGKVHRDSQIRE